MSSGAAASGLFSNLGSLFSSLTPNQWMHLTKHLSSSDEMKGMEILDAMEQNPAGAGNLIGALTQINNLPEQVVIDVTEAVKNPTSPLFGDEITQAKAALAAAVSNNLLGL